MRKESTLYRMNVLNSNDITVQNIIDAICKCLDNNDLRLQQVVSDLFFDACSEEMLKFYEQEAGIVPLETQTMEDRRSTLQARWWSADKCNLAQLQLTADAWKYGKVIADFVNDTITITFNDKGIPLDLEGLKQALEEVKPAHLPIEYIFIWNTWNDVSNLTWNQVSTNTWEELKVR